MIRLYFCSLLFFVFQLSFAQSDNNILNFISEPIQSNSFSEYRAAQHIGNQLSSPKLGIKFYTNQDRRIITAILIAHDSLTIDHQKYNRFSSHFPYVIQSTNVINNMSQEGFLFLDSTSLSYVFIKDKFKCEYVFSDYKRKILNYTLWSLNENFSDEKESLELTEVNNSSPNDDYLAESIINVLSSSLDLGVKNISRNSMHLKNLWNYKYVFNTDLKIPGELYSMVYAFPFQNSQKDYVSVLAESGYSRSISQTYFKFLKHFRLVFNEENGWSSYAEKNTNTRSMLDDIYFKHQSYGTFVLDYSQTPKGKEVVYLRFLFQYQ